jgi:hypothetical protein
MKVSKETAYDLGVLSELTDQDIIQFITSDYRSESDLYVVETTEGVTIGVDSDSVYHMESGIVLDWFDVESIHINSLEEINAPRTTWFDRNGNREES